MKKQKKADLPISWRPNLYDYLKILALITMLIDHIGYYLFPEALVLRLIGRIAFPIFLFLVGFNGSFRWRRELFWRGIGIRAFTSFVAWHFSFWSFGANILIAILLARGLMHFLLETKNKILWFISFRSPLLRESLFLFSSYSLATLWCWIFSTMEPYLFSLSFDDEKDLKINSDFFYEFL